MTQTMAYEASYSAAEGAEIDRASTNKRQDVRVQPYVSSPKQVIGLYILKSPGFGKVGPATHGHPIMHRPPENARVRIERYFEKEDTWRIQDCILGAGYRCNGCGDAFGKSESISEHLSRNIPAARYRVIDDEGRQEDAFFCFKATECAERAKTALANGAIRPIMSDEDLETTLEGLSERITSNTAYQAMVEAVGEEDAPLPPEFLRCALPSCGRPYMPFAPGYECCTSAHKMTLDRMRGQQARAESPAVQAARKGQKAALKTRLANKAKPNRGGRPRKIVPPAPQFGELTD